MKVLSFGGLLLSLAAPGFAKLFQKDRLDSIVCGGEANAAVSLANNSGFLPVGPDNHVGKLFDAFYRRRL